MPQQQEIPTVSSLALPRWSLATRVGFSLHVLLFPAVARSRSRGRARPAGARHQHPLPGAVGFAVASGGALGRSECASPAGQLCRSRQRQRGRTLRLHPDTLHFHSGSCCYCRLVGAGPQTPRLSAALRLAALPDANDRRRGDDWLWAEEGLLVAVSRAAAGQASRHLRPDIADGTAVDLHGRIETV